MSVNINKVAKQLIENQPPINSFEKLTDDGVARIEIENNGNLCMKKYENMPKNRYYIVSGSQDIAVIDFDAELDDDDWEDDLDDDD